MFNDVLPSVCDKVQLILVKSMKPDFYMETAYLWLSTETVWLMCH